MYVLKYSKRDQSYNHPAYHGMYVGLDSNSGGYPFATSNFSQAEIFADLTEAKRYQSMFPCLDIFKLEITLISQE